MTPLEIFATALLSFIGLALILAGANACLELWRAIRKLTRPRVVIGSGYTPDLDGELGIRVRVREGTPRCDDGPPHNAVGMVLDYGFCARLREHPDKPVRTARVRFDDWQGGHGEEGREWYCLVDYLEPEPHCECARMSVKPGDIVLARGSGSDWKQAFEAEVVEVCPDGDVRVRPTPATVARWCREFNYDPTKDGSGISRHYAKDVRLAR